ncbi:MAG: radical SAM protein [Halobacteriota archaeon]|nr:radical SAM protein [Halobacteriota archaeon]
MVNSLKNKILLVVPPAWDEVIPPLGVCQLKAYLKKNGYSAEIIDLNLRYFIHRDKTGTKTPKLPWHPLKEYISENFISSDSSKYIQKVIGKPMSEEELDKERRIKEILDGASKELLNCISQDNIDVVGFSTFSPSYQSAVYIAKKVKEETLDTLIVFGGPQVSYLKEEVLFFPWIDVAIAGEGELAFLDLLNRSESGKISPLYYGRDVDGDIRPQQQTTEPLDISKLPPPNFDDYDLEKMPVSLLPISLTRGCSRSCNFCGVNTNNVNGSFRSKSIEEVISEIEYYIKTYEVRNFAFTDGILNFNSNMLERLCSEIIDCRLEINWCAQLVPQVTKDEAENVKKAGGEMVYCDPETGCQRIADMMGKGTDIINAKKAIQNLSSARINVSSWFMFGFPGETEDDFIITKRFIKDIKEYLSEFIALPFSLYRGCKVYQDPETFGIELLSDIPCEYLAIYSEGGNINFGYSSVGARRAIQIWEELKPETHYPFERLKEYSAGEDDQKRRYSYVTQLKEMMAI